MEQSLFIDFIKKYFPKLVLGITERINGKEGESLYFFRRLLGTSFSVDGRWESLIGDYTRIAADIVSMDSSLPLKKRDPLARASGDLPKLGMELYLNEKQMSDIDAMIAMNFDESAIVAKIFEDVPRVIAGVDERLEYMTLKGLSSGVAIAETENMGAGVRIDYGYLDSNKFGAASKVWSNTESTPISDIQRVVNKASNKGLAIVKGYADPTAIDNMLKTDEVKQYFASSIGFGGSSIPIPSLEQLNVVLLAKFGFVLEKVAKSVITQKDGVNTAVNAWTQHMVVLTADEKVGDIVWTRLAEQNHPVAGVEYQVANLYTLVSKYRVNRPSLREYTASQARAIPVITNVDRIFTLNTNTVQV